MFIDCHMHAFSDKIADKAVAQLIDYYQIPTGHGGRFTDLLTTAMAAGLDALVMLVAATRPEQVKSAHDWVLAITGIPTNQLRQEHSLPPAGKIPAIIPFGTYHPGDPDWCKELDRLRAAGIKGVKLHPEFQGIDLADPGLDDFWAEVENDFILMIHVGDPVVSPANFSTPAKIATLLDRFPKLTVIAAHMGGYLFWEEVYEILAGRNLYLDTSSTLGFIAPELFQRIIQKHGAERVLFGSDYPLRTPKQDMDVIQGFNWLKAREKEMILGENCARLFNVM